MFIRTISYIPWYLVGITMLVVLFATLAGDYLLKGDIIETFHMGRELSLFYPKHPPVTFWLTGGVLQLVPMDLLLPAATLILYAGYAFVAYMAWKFSRLYFDDDRICVLISFAVGLSLFTKFIYLTPDYMVLVLSPLLAWSFYKAVTEDRLWDWLWVAVLALLLFFSKYQAVVTFCTLALVLLLTAQGRACFRSKHFWYAVTVVLAVVGPYLAHLLQQEVAAVSYAQSGAGMQKVFHLKGAWSAPLAAAFLPLLFCIIFFSFKKLRVGFCAFFADLKAGSFNIAFLLINSIGYWGVWLVFCVAFEHELQSRFIIMNVIFFNILIFIWAKPLISTLSDRKLRLTIGTLTVLSAAAFVINVYKDNNWQEVGLFETAYSQIRQEVGEEIDYMVVNHRALDTFYTAFDEKPRFIVMDYADKAAIYSEMSGQTVLFMWREKDGPEPDWIAELQARYPQLSAMHTVDLQAQGNRVLGVRFRDAKFHIHYMYLLSGN
ncbi:MAG: glycosyltransferase family 39 protein [Amphritea sp.]|nr:glycosyltransferase family 39 protein [Amphritea sp.]